MCTLVTRCSASSPCVSHLALLVAVRQNLQAVGGDGQKLDVGVGEQGHQLLQASGQAHRHLGSLLVQQQVVEGGDGIEQHRVHRGAGHTNPNERFLKHQSETEALETFFN